MLLSSVLHRYPVVTPDAEDWEQEMWELQDKIERKKREVLSHASY